MLDQRERQKASSSGKYFVNCWLSFLSYSPGMFFSSCCGWEMKGWALGELCGVLSFCVYIFFLNMVSCGDAAVVSFFQSSRLGSQYHWVGGLFSWRLWDFFFFF
ncbi:unnamed protein product [Ilex paraguariensis]|uniref:Uncharacterized protein n=1 Tax=Ilex paraguariensis TaxID=185542 RepID=A0ABC8SCV8_9AQUA